MRKWVRSQIRLAGFAMVAAAAGPFALAQDALVRSTLDGIYTTGQASRGANSFARECTECHELAEFIGADALLPTESGKALWPIFDFMWSEMPEDRPAWLEPEVYADILAYFLQAFGMPAGAEELRPDPEYLQTIRLESANRDGG